jgi:hypothetical protein
LEHESLVSATFEGRRVDIVIHNSLYFQLCLRDDYLFLQNIRELRKLVDGSIIFDDQGTIASTIASYDQRELPLHILQKIALQEPICVKSLNPPEERARLALQFERTAFLSLNSRTEFRYRKSKWMLDDICRSGLPWLMEFADATITECAAGIDVGAMVSALLVGITRAPRLEGPQPLGTIEDAAMLVRRGRSRAAVLPLRLAAMRAALAHAPDPGPADHAHRIVMGSEMLMSEDREFGVAVRSVLLLDTPPTEAIRRARDRAVTGLENCLGLPGGVLTDLPVAFS